MKATFKQVRAIYLMAADLGFTERELKMLTSGRKPEELTKKEASNVIQHLKNLLDKERAKEAL